MLSIQTNVNSMNAQENLRTTNLFQGRTIARLTSGYRINESGDDAAGLAVANKFRSDVSELSQGVRNANDGLSTMQIIDGGLNNISKMLDRLKTLATQSASSTFTGNRATLNQEYGSLLKEIDRQASNVGLGNEGGSASRYNRNLNVYIGGGGDYAANSGVAVDLSSKADKVSGRSLGISGTTINGGTVIEVANAQDLRGTDGAGKTLLQGQSQTVTVNVNGDSRTVTLDGGVNGMNAFDAVANLNNKVADLDISFVIDSGTGKLNVVSNKAWTVQINNQATGLASAASNTMNTSMYNADASQALVAIAGGDTETMAVTNTATGTSRTLTITGAITADAAGRDAVVDKINQDLADIGVFATISSNGAGIALFSASQFTLAAPGGTAAAGCGAFAAAAPTVTAPNITANETSAAQQAILAISTAVGRLGVVQGKIGTAQNKISYAIQLAQSQITSFSAAESRIRDADVASEAANLTKAQVLQQASLAALAQANSAPQAVLSLLRG